MKSLEKATEDYRKAKARAEQLQSRAAQAVRKMKDCEAAMIEAENMEIVRIVRETEMTVPELLEWKKKGRPGLPEAAPGKEKETSEKCEKDPVPDA